MELFGILLSIPATFVASAIYSIILKWFLSRCFWIFKVFFWPSLIILALLFLEFMGVVSVGPLTLRAIIGPAFYPIHFLLFLFSIPCLANLIQIQKAAPFVSRWYIAALACSVFGLCVVLLQYGVSEALYGINGTDGPYS